MKVRTVLGFSQNPKETSPGVYTTEIVERPYYGEVYRNTRKLVYNDRILPDIEVNNVISVVGDQYAFENFYAIRYARYMGVLWNVTDVKPGHPRLELTLGGQYHGDTPRTPSGTCGCYR